MGLILGVLILQPPVVAPMFQANPDGAPPWFPFLFITIACGAISGFHGLVSSGTTSKQVNKWSDTRAIGYGGMLGEGTLALLATLAVSAGFADSKSWHNHFSSWGEAKGLSASIEAFVLGSSRFLGGVGVPVEFAKTMMSVLIISFAATSLDTATRIQRYVIAEVGETSGIGLLKQSWVAAGLAVLSALFLMLIDQGGKGGLVLWPLFGAANQMLAALILIVVSVYLIKNKKSATPYIIPLVFLLIVTLFGLAFNLSQFINSQNYLLASLSAVLLITELWIVIEALTVIRNNSRA